MSTPLPVVTEAYRRLTRPAEDPYGVSNEPSRYEMRRIAAKAELMARQSTSTLPNSGTLPSQDLLFSYTKNTAGNTVFRRLEAKTSHGNVTESETSDVVQVVVYENLEAFWKVLEQEDNKKAVRSTSNATNSYSATQYRAEVGSATTMQPLEDRYSWVKVVYELVRVGKTSKALRVIYAAVESHFKEQSFTALSEILAEIDLGRLNPQTMTALLRISGRAKEVLPTWASLLGRARAELTGRNVPDIPGIMVGLGG
jgi:hypothetical protein